MRAEFAVDLDAVGFAERRPQRVRNEMQGRLVHRTALDRVQGACVGAAVLLKPALEQDHQRGLASRGRPEEQEQPATDFGAGAGRFEVVDETLEGLVDAEQFVLEELAAETTFVVHVALRANHVPDVLVAAAANAFRIGRNDGLEKLGECAGPMRRAMVLAELVQGP